MEIIKKKCAFKDHKEIDSIAYCQECKIYMCNKCTNYHKGLFENHHQYNLDKDIKDIFIDICKEENHPMKIEYFCKNHNLLCCAACISKIEGKGNGKHKDCDICFIEDIKEEKKNKLKENIKFLEELSNDLENSIKELKIMFEKINERKEKLKTQIQKTFTKMRNILNDREDELLLEVDNQFNNLFCKEDIIKESEKLPDKVKLSLQKGKSINNEWNDNNKLSSIINDCIYIEMNIKNINSINNSIKKCSTNNDTEIIFIPEDENIDNFTNVIKTFGNISKKIFNLLEAFNLDSLILNKKDDSNKFYKLISNNIKINNMKLIYRLSKDGLKYQTISNKIENKSNLIFLYFTGNKRIFGAYIKTKLEKINSDRQYNDENAFVFSLNNNKIYKILIPQKAIRLYNGDDCPILIGNTGQGNGFYFSENKIYDKGLMNEPKIYDFQRNNELTEGFDILNELEIFEINSN